MSSPAQAPALAPKLQTKLSIPFPDDARSGGLSIVGILAHAEPLGALYSPSTAAPAPIPAPAAAAAAPAPVAGPGEDDVLKAEAEKAANDAVLDPAVTLASASSSAERGGDLPLGAPPRPEPKPLALILHGVLAHKDQIYHKKLVAALEMDSFRFDFRANHETPGEWNMASFYEDLRDLRCVISHLRRFFNYRVHVMIAHSRGALDLWVYLGEQERNRRRRRALEAQALRGPGSEVAGGIEGVLEEEVPPFAISLSGRWRMERIYDRLPVWKEGFEKEGFYRWKARVAGKDIEVHVTPQAVEDFARFPIADYVRDAPVSSDILLIQGTADQIVPTADIGYYMNAVGSQAGRTPGSVQMHLIDDADHNFVGHFDEVVTTIVNWLKSRQHVSQSSKTSSFSSSSSLASASSRAETAASSSVGVDSSGTGLIPSRATATAGAGKL
ncbi:hypothetical protein OC835_003118 [Tilletia horrida]|nr:hypothetical protein OC835_003118 [Tilletia horrida]